MCQLLGLSAKEPTALTFSLKGFIARAGQTDSHVDGWGAGFYDHDGVGCRLFHDDLPASDSPWAQALKAYPIRSRIALIHIRKATHGEISLANCHPFQRVWLGRTWLFASNGTLHDFEPSLSGIFQPVGTTDSEVAFGFLMQELNRRFAGRSTVPSWRELAPEVARISATIAQHGNFNMLFSNGGALYAHCSHRLQWLQRQPPFANACLTDGGYVQDLSQVNQNHDRMVVVATSPLTSNEDWKAFEPGESRLFMDGNAVWHHRDPSTKAFPPANYHVGRSWILPKSGVAE